MCKKKYNPISGVYTCIYPGSGYPTNYDFQGDILKVLGQNGDSKFEYIPNQEVKEDGRSYYDTVKIDGTSYFFEYKNENSFNFRLDMDQPNSDDIHCEPKWDDSKLKQEQEKINKMLRDHM